MEHDTRCPIDTLPTEVLIHIFTILASPYFDQHTLYMVVPAVCTRWKDVCLRLSNMPITLNNGKSSGTTEYMSNISSVCATNATATQLSTTMRRVRSIASIRMITWSHDISHTVMSLVPSFAPTLVSLKLNNVICTRSVCQVRLITKHCVNIVTLHIDCNCSFDCRHNELTAGDILCTKLRNFVCNMSRPVWIQQVVAATPVQNFKCHGWSPDIQDYPLVFKHPALVKRLSIIPYIGSNASPARISALHSGLCNLVEISVTSQHWVAITDTVRRQCPNLQTLTVYEYFQDGIRIDYTVFRTGFTNLQFLVVHEAQCAGTCHPAMFAPLLALPALTHFITEHNEEAAITLPNVTCLTWRE
jgi:hypothetical protein